MYSLAAVDSTRNRLLSLTLLVATLGLWEAAVRLLNVVSRADRSLAELRDPAADDADWRGACRSTEDEARPPCGMIDGNGLRRPLSGSRHPAPQPLSP